jgi:hypothetical protein
MDPQQANAVEVMLANAVEVMLEGVDGHVAALVDDQRRCHEGTEKLLKDMTCLLRRVAADYTAVRAKVAATEKDKSDALECVTNVERTIARREFTLERVSEALVAAQGKRAALERALACASARFAAAELLVNQLKEQLHQSSADAPIRLHIKLGGGWHSTKCSLCEAVLTGPVATAELELDLIDALNRAAAAEQRTRELHKALHEVDILDVDTNRTEQGLVEPAPKRLKRLQDGTRKLQAQAAETQVRVKQEKVEVAEVLEVSN